MVNREMTKASPPALPELVLQAEQLAAANDFSNSCTRRTGNLLRTLAASAAGTILELGTGYGVGSAWILSGMREGGKLLSIDLDAQRQEAVASQFAHLRNVEFVQGEWREALPHGPFDLAFVDAGGAKDGGADEVIAAVKIGGILVLDDFTPGPLYRGRHDERWHHWMQHPQLVSCEVLIDEGAAAIVATRVG